MKQVAAAIMVSDDKVLIAKRKSEDPAMNKWEFPGGKVELGESPEECLVREINEELGIQIKVRDFFCSSTYTYEKGTIELIAYFVDWLSRDMDVREHQEIKWVSKHELRNFDFLPADIPIVERLLIEV